ncbi:MAG: tetratricopeptide repeat protein [Bdellovibrionales bacterium]|nr:tetratricopeptide repeat protein [Bdellovibrionales bacterium]
MTQETVQVELINADGRLNARLLLKNARVLLAAGDLPLAKNIFRALIEAGELLGTAYSGLGAVLEVEGKLDLAIKAYREAIIYEPTYGSLLALSELLIKKEEFKSAIGTLLRASHLGALSPSQGFDIQKHLGNCYMHLDQLNNAEAAYRKAFELKPDSDPLHVNIGSLALKRNDPATALLNFKEAVRINPLNPAAHCGVGLARMAMGEKELAMAAFQAALDADIHEVQALYNLVRCAYELKRFEPAREVLARYIACNPVNSNILYSYAGILFHCGRLQEAGDECDKLLSFNPEHGGAKRIKDLILARTV